MTNSLPLLRNVRTVLGSASFRYTAALVITTLIAAWAGPELLALIDKETASRFFREDGLVENMAAAFFAIAAVLSLVGVVRASGNLPLRLLALFACLAALAGFLSEVSFGARLFGFDMPMLMGGGELDGFHDPVIVLKRALKSAGIPTWLVLALAGGVVIGLAILIKFLYNSSSTLESAFRLFFQSPSLLAACIVVAMAILMDASNTFTRDTMEEALELGGAILLSVFSIQLLRNMNTTTSTAA